MENHKDDNEGTDPVEVEFAVPTSALQKAWCSYKYSHIIENTGNKKSGSGFQGERPGNATQKTSESKSEPERTSKAQKATPPYIRLVRGKPRIVPILLGKFFKTRVKCILVRNNLLQSEQIYIYQDGVYKPYSNNSLVGTIMAVAAEYNEEIIRMCDMKEARDYLLAGTDYVTPDDLDADEMVINFKNGILHLDDLSLRPQTPELLSTIQIPISWTDSPPPTPVFDAYMHTLTDGDAEVEQLLLEFIGVCLSNIKGWRMKKALFLVGDGDTGKSQLKSLVERLLGRGNFIGIDLKELEQRFGTSTIYGKRLAGSSDMSFMTVEELKTFKKLTGGDSLFAEFKGKDGFEFVYSGLLWFCMNRLPMFGGDDGRWVYDRIMIVECPNVIPKDKQDKELLDKMYAERDGIVYKAVMALKNVIANGYRFSEPDSVASARNTYQEKNNSVINFYHDCMCPWPEDRIDINCRCTTGRIYKVYKAWCLDYNNGHPKSARDFRENLASCLSVPYNDLITARQGENFFIDFTLTENVQNEYINILLG